MATPARMKGYGATLAYSTTVGGAYTTLTGLKNFTPPAPKGARVKNHDLNAATQVVTSQRGWIDPGEMPLTLYFDRAQYNTILGFLSTGVEYFWKVTFPMIGGESTASKLTAPGYVAEVKLDEISIDDENLVMLPIVVQLNDVPTFTPGS